VTDSDARLVERARSGDGAAFEVLVRRHLRAAYAVAFAALGNVADTEDACQDAFVTALTRLEDCRQPDHFGAWLVQIARNRAHSLRRQRSVRAADSLDRVQAAARTDPSRDAERAELRGRLETAVEALPAVQREVLLLHDLEGWRHREIGEELGLPEGTVRSHLFHARRSLRERLGEPYAEKLDDSGSG
jgi:RNA polymerase sigma-70 factor, ECF subfamily